MITKCRQFWYRPYLHIDLTPCQYPTPHGTFTVIHEPTLTHHCHSKSIVYIRIHLWCCASHEFEQMWNRHLSTVTVSDRRNWTVCALPFHSFLSTANHRLPLIFLRSSQFCLFHVIETLQYVVFSDGNFFTSFQSLSRVRPFHLVICI